MGLAQSHADFFRDANRVDGDRVDVFAYLRREEQKLWRVAPSWEQQADAASSTFACAASEGDSSQAPALLPSDPAKPLSPEEALELVPKLMHDGWIAPLAALVESADAAVQSVALALLAKIVRTASAEEIFVRVGGTQKVVELLCSALANVQYLALEAVFALCARNARVVPKFCELGLVRRLATLTRSAAPEIVLASLKILRLTLHDETVKAEMAPCEMLAVLMDLVASPNQAIVKAAVICVGLSLPNAANLREITRLGCVDAFLRLLTPGYPNADAVAFALSLVAAEADTIFPRDATLAATTRMLETLRGAAKRSRTASAMGFLFAALARSSLFHRALCTEPHLSILSKLLVGGSADVLCASAFALGVVGIYAVDASVTELLYRVEAPQNLTKLLAQTPPASEEVLRLVIFALACALHPGAVLSAATSAVVHPDMTLSEPRRVKMTTTCEALRATQGVVELVYARAVEQLATGSMFAAKLLACLIRDDSVRQRCYNALCVRRMLAFTRLANSAFLATCLAFFVECSAVGGDTSAAFYGCIEQLDGDDDVFLPPLIELFEHHAPERVLGLPVLLTNVACSSTVLRAALSVHVVVQHALAAVTRLDHVALHDQVLRFLDTLTRDKNERALRVLFESDVDRVANLLQSPLASIQLLAGTLLRRVFKRLNASSIPSAAAQRHLVKLLSGAGEDASAVAVAAARVWGNLLLYDDKRERFAAIPHATEALLVLATRCAAVAGAQESAAKNLHVVVRSVYRSVLHDDGRRAMVAAPHFLSLVDHFDHADERVVHLTIETLIEVARLPALRKHVAVAAALTTACTILRDLGSDEGTASSRAVARIDVLRLVGVLAKKEPWTQNLLLEYKVVDAANALLRSSLTTADGQLLHYCLEALAWMASGVDSPVRPVLATAETVELALRHVESPDERVTSAALHLLHRLALEPVVQDMVGGKNGPALIMRVLNQREDFETRRRACALIRHLARNHDANSTQFQSLGAISYLVALVTESSVVDTLRVKGLDALAAMVEGSSAVAKRCKHEALECEGSTRLVRLVGCTNEPRVCTAWCLALAMVALGSPGNQRKLASTEGLVVLLVQFVASRDHTILRVRAAQLLAYLAALPENRAAMMTEGGDTLPAAVIGALQAESHELQRFSALLVANLATRSDENKVQLGASGVVSPLVDRLSSKQPHVLENVLGAVTKLGGHAGNKVKLGSKVCFEKLLALVHHEELAIRKSAVGAVAVLIEGNDANKRFLLQCEARVVAELCALLKSTNGKVVESAMLILGELSQLPEQALEISQSVDVLAVVRMVEHVNVRIKRAALATAANLTKESFNKLRFGVRECVAALLRCLQADDLRVVELALACLANLSFTAANASLIAHAGALLALLKLTAASTTAKDYLTWKEARFLRLDKHHAVSERSPTKEHSSRAESEAHDGDSADVEGDWSDGDTLDVYTHSGIDGASDEVLDFSSFPSRQTYVLEQALLVLSNCGEELHSRGLVEKVAVKVVSQTLAHPSELVKRCACFVLACWCRRDAANQELATRAGVLPVLVQLLSAPSAGVVEAAVYALGKLSYYSDNHAKLLGLDALGTIVDGILRRSASLAHPGLLDRALRLLGTLAGFHRVRQVLKSEEIVADVLTGLLQLHRDALAKNASRLVLAMLQEDSLRFFLPKKTVVLLRAVFVDAASSPKTVRNVLRVFRVLALVEEHKTTIALEDSGEALGRMVQELDVVAEEHENLLRVLPSAPNAETLLQLLACLSATKRVAAILFEKQFCAVLPRYLAPFEGRTLEPDGDAAEASDELASTDLLQSLEMNANAVVIARHLCASRQDAALATISALDFTALMLRLLRTSARLVPTRLTQIAFECLGILERLCPSDAAYDQHMLFHEDAVDVFAFFLARWLRVVGDGGDRTLLTLGASCDALDAVEPLEFVVPLAQLLTSLATHPENRNALVHKGCAMQLLQAMGVSSLSSRLRLSFATTFAALSELPAAKSVFDATDHVSLLFKFMFAHQSSPELLLLSLRAFASVVELSPSSRRHILDHAPALSFLLGCLADAQSDSRESKVFFAVHALECLSAEQEIAGRLAPLETLPLVPQLLLLPLETISRETQHFAAEMVGHMAFFGHADKLRLDERMVTRILSFAAFDDTDELVTPALIRLAFWSLAQLANSSLSPTVCKWLVDDAARLDVLVRCGLLPPHHLPISSTVVSYVLSILIRIVDVEDVVCGLVSRRICTPLSALLEAVEQHLRLSALQILALLLPRYTTVPPDEVAKSEQWPVILCHLVEWMEVYARDLSSVSPPSLLDAFTALSFLASLSAAVASEFATSVLRSGVTDIVANALVHFESSSRVEPLHQRILLRALETSGHLMRFTAAYSDKLLALGAQAALESLLHHESDALQLETLRCMNHLATLHVEHHAMFASHRCVVRLRQLAQDASLEIASKVTPLLALMVQSAPSLPGLCCLDGIDVVSTLVVAHWTPQRSEQQARVTEDGGAVLLAMFASEANVFALYDRARVIDKLFEVVETRGMPELPLRVLTKISDYAPSRARFIALLPRLCRLLAGVSASLGTTSHHLVLVILFNLFCRDDADAAHHGRWLADGEAALLPQLLPLSRWVRVASPESVELVLKLLHAYVVTPPYATLLNDAANTPALLELVAAENSDVAVATAEVLLTVASEREMQISITVEDGVGVLVRTLQRSSHLPLQRLVLTLLRDMSADSEVQALILHDGGVARLVEFVSERSAALFELDNRLALACEVLRQLSQSAGATAPIVASHGHVRLIELNKQQLEEATSTEKERATTLETLANLAKTAAVAQPLIDAKLHELFLLYLHAGDPSDAFQRSCSSSGRLALAGLRVLCQVNKPIRRTLGSKSELMVLLEANIARVSSTTDAEVVERSLALLLFLSKETEGRQSIYAATSTRFLECLCGLIVAAVSPSPLSSSSAGASKPPTTPAIRGAKVIANLLNDSSEQRLRVAWDFASLLSLSPLLETLLADHQHAKTQLTALQVLAGALRSPAFYFDLSPQMLGDVLNVVLISASREHRALAEGVVVRAFEDPQRVRASIGGNQILERLLIVVTQTADAAQRRALGTALTEALYASRSREFVVNQRFLSKVLSLLASVSASAGEADARDAQLVRALCVYLGFVFESADLRMSICEVLRSEVDAAAFESVAGQVLAVHAQICGSCSPGTAALEGGSSTENLQLWTLFAACLAPPAPHIRRVLERVQLAEWLCVVDDFFALCSNSDHTSSSQQQDDGLIATLRVASALSMHATSSSSASDTVESELNSVLLERKQSVGVRCLESLRQCSDAHDQHPAVTQAALRALLDIRDGWSESCLLGACRAFAHTGDVLVALLQIFHLPARTLDTSRHLLLQLLLTLVSTGSFVEELKASDVQRAIETNELIAAADKALPITILSLLGYNADLNGEFAVALDRCANASSALARKDGVAFLVNFLQLYALTDEGLQLRGICVFMGALVTYAAEFEETRECDGVTSREIARSALVGLVRLSSARKFVELFAHSWTLNALLGVAFARRKSGAPDFRERASFEPHEISELLSIAARVCSWLGAPTPSPIEETTLANALTLVATLSSEHLMLAEQVLELLSWLLGDHGTFDMVCHHASELAAFLPFLFAYADSGAAVLKLLETCVRDAPRVDCLSDLLARQLAFVYANAVRLSKASHARDKLLLYVLVALKRCGEEGLAGTNAYEHAIQRILANVRAPSVSEARMSWSLLGMLTEFDPAIVLIFNLDGVQLLLRELCVASSSSSSRTSNGSSLVTSSQATSAFDAVAFPMEALKCLSKAARTHDEVLLKIGEAPGVAAILFAVLANGPAVTPRDDATMNVGECQEHAAHLIARIASQEGLRAALLSPEHVAVLIESLESVHLAVVLSALEALYHLCELALCLDALVRHATVPVLGQILFSPLATGGTQQRTEEFVLGILGSMCAKSKLICRRVVSSNMVAKLNGYLGAATRRSVQHNAAWVLHSLSKDPELVPKLRDAGVLETLCGRLLEFDPRTTQRQALGALANLVARNRGSTSASVDEDELLRSVVRETVEAINRSIPHSQAQQAVAKGLRVFEAFAMQGDDAKRVLVDENALQLTLSLLGAPDVSVRLRALHVALKWVDANRDAALIRDLFSDAALLHLVRTVSEEPSDALLVALALLNALANDELLQDKLAAMTYEVLLRLVATHTSPSLTAAQSRVLVEALQCLVAMTKAGRVAVSTASEIANSVAPLVLLLQTSASDAIRISALHLLVNFAASVELRGSMVRCGMLQAVVEMLATAVTLGDDKIVQLCLLGMALLTAVDFSGAVADLAGGNVVTLVELLGSRNRSIQANAVWVLSNISSDARLQSEIVARGGATTLQALLHEATSSSDASVHAGSARPTSSSMRIREYAPKAIRSLGFAPLAHESFYLPKSSG